MTPVTVGSFKAAKVAHEYEDGWRILYLDTVDDLVTLGNLMHHCSGSLTHTRYACHDSGDNKIVYFFVLVDEKGTPHSTIHAKQATWVNKPHPGGCTTAYDVYVSPQYRERPSDTSFEVIYRCPLPNQGNIPKGVDQEVWDNFVKAHKAMSDNHRKNVGNVKVVGRRIKFDGKYLIILSASGSYQSDVSGYRKKIGEWLNELGKKKKEEVAA